MCDDGFKIRSRIEPEALICVRILTWCARSQQTVSSDYRLGPTISVLDGPVSDSVAAYEWARNELPQLLGKEHGITVDGKNIVTLGHSCGGGLSLLMVSKTLQL